MAVIEIIRIAWWVAGQGNVDILDLMVFPRSFFDFLGINFATLT